jgi:hypothetical protein
MSIGRSVAAAGFRLSPAQRRAQIAEAATMDVIFGRIHDTMKR